MDFREQFRRARDKNGGDEDAARKFLMVHFECCNTYGRMYRNRDQTQYVGRCPKCGARVTAKIGPGGTSHRIFRAQKG